jgi:hypothetical protein
MATIWNLERRGILKQFQVPNDVVGRLPVRPLWMSQSLIEYLEDTLDYRPEKVASRTASEHLEQFFVDFRCNGRIHADDLRRMIPNRAGVWSMHPPMLRVYGWVPRHHAMIAVHAALESDTKNDPTLNDRCRDHVLEFIRRHGVTEIVYGDFRNAFPKAT